MKKIDLTGRKYNRLTVIKQSEKRTSSNQIKWDCICTCGKSCSIMGSELRSGGTKSCGCLHTEIRKTVSFKHGYAIKKCMRGEYRAWAGMKSRCYNPKNERYPIYGGIGVIVSDRWINSFENFLSDMGERPSILHSIDRYPNNSGNYGPENCRWATEKQQQGNRRNNIWFEYNGKKMIQKDWADYFGVHGRSIIYHLKNGKDFSEIAQYYGK